MRTRVIYAATAILLLLIGTVSVLIFQATERDVVGAFSEQQLAVARTVSVALDAEVKALSASLRQLNSLPSVQGLEVEFVGQRVAASFAPEPHAAVRRVVRIAADERRYAWSMRGDLVDDGASSTLDRAVWDWSADRAHAGQIRIGPVWWDRAAPADHRALTIPVWRVASAAPLRSPPNDFNGVLAFEIDARRLLSTYSQPAAVDATHSTLSLDFGGDVSSLRIGSRSPSAITVARMHSEAEGTAIMDGVVWAWAHLPVADRTWAVTIGTPYEVASARVDQSGLRQLGLVAVLLVLVPAVGWVLVRRERGAEEERRAMQLQLAEVQKMDAIGKLAGGIAHDFNNLLTAILGHTTIILEDVPEGSPVQEQAAQVRRAAESAATLTQKLLAFSRSQVLNRDHVDTSQLLRDLMLLVRRLVGEHIEVVSNLQQDVWPIIADRVQVEQAIINLAVNARDAMPNGGRLEIVTRNAPRPHGELHSDHMVRPGDYVQIIVRDTGLGMDESTRTRMFEPFFTTKPKGKGTGLGLSSVWGIVKQSGGYIHVTSTPEAGTTMELLLPRAAKTAAPAPATRERDREAPGSETILLVDDEAAVREFARTALERQGYHVLTADGPDDALRIAQDFRDGIALLLTDVRMPGMQGPELATHLRLIRPGLRVLFMSGYAAEAMSKEGLKGAPLLQKPFKPSVLTHAVRFVLDRTA